MWRFGLFFFFFLWCKAARESSPLFLCSHISRNDTALQEKATVYSDIQNKTWRQLLRTEIGVFLERSRCSVWSTFKVLVQTDHKFKK